jgi:UDP-N-acetylglucosamine 1-carboxyvinyltransferase
MITDTFHIQGLAGARTLVGSIPVGGAKNAALKAMAATLLFSNEVVLKNVPDIEDIRRIADLLADIGFGVDHKDKNTYVIEPKPRISTVLNPEIARKIRSSIVLTGESGFSSSGRMCYRRASY